MPYKWPPGLPTKGTRVSLDCGARGHQLNGTVIEDGPVACVVKWDHGIIQCHPNSHLVPEKEAR
jgi:hypothetical protein